MPLHERDAGLAEAAERLRQVRARFRALSDEFEIDIKTEDKEIDPYRNALDNRLDDFLIETKPPTLAGAAVMLRHGLGARGVYFINGGAELVENVLALIERGGLPERTAPDDVDAVAEAAEMAALDFEPIDNAVMIADFSEPAFGKMTGDMGVDLRLAALILGQRKSELVDMARELGVDVGLDLAERLVRTSKHLQQLIGAVLDPAINRLMMAASAAGNGKEGGVA